MQLRNALIICLSAVLGTQMCGVIAWSSLEGTMPGYGPYMSGNDPGTVPAVQHPYDPYGYGSAGHSYPTKKDPADGAPYYGGYPGYTQPKAAEEAPYYTGYPGYTQPKAAKEAPYYTGYPGYTQPKAVKETPYYAGYPGYTQPVAVGTRDPGYIVMGLPDATIKPAYPQHPREYYPVDSASAGSGQYVNPYAPKPVVSPVVPAAAKTPLAGYCSVKITFSVCSLVGRTETFHYLKQKYEAPGNLPVLDITAKREDKSYFGKRAECSCKTEYKIMASKNVTTMEEADFYINRLKPIFEAFVTKDEKFICIDYGTPVYSGEGCPAPEAAGAATPAVPATKGATATATATATSNGGGPASATAISTGGDATAVATATGGTKCRVVKVVKLCVTDKKEFSNDVQTKEKEYAQMLGIKKKAFHNDLKYSDAPADKGFCSENLALLVEISIPVASAEEGNAMLQAIDSLASLLVGQTLPSVVGGEDGAPAVAQCV